MRMDANEQRRAEPRARMLWGDKHWRNAWMQHMNVDFARLELLAAAQMAQIDHKAIAWNAPLCVDKYLDRRLQG